MTLRQKKALQRSFFRELGPNGILLRDMFYNLPTEIAFNMKDRDCRIMAINRCNCEICNIRDEWDAIGLKSSQIFPASYAENYMSLDQQVLKSGKPILGCMTQYPADRSINVTITNVFPLRNSAGAVIGTARSYILSSDVKSSERYGRIREAADFVDHHFAEEITISQLARLANLPEARFKKYFSRVFGMTPGRYIITIRLNAVRELLTNTGKLISDIALETGFFDQSHLTRIFKKERGMTPGTYRRQHQPRAALANGR